MIIDTHCHIDLYANPKQILQDSVKANITVLAMTNLPSHFEVGLPYILPLKKIRLALGMHPLYAEQHNREFPTFLKNLHKTSYIGEVGLDFSREGFPTKEIQISTFEKVLAAISTQKKILSIHSRRAEKEVLALLVEYRIKSAIFHWYSGPLNLIDEITKLGYFLSINPTMTKSASGRKIISKIPKQFVLTETDGPFIDENNVPIKPGQVQTVITFLANEWMLSEEKVKMIIRDNFMRIIAQIK